MSDKDGRGIRLERKAQVARITLTRSERANAYDEPMLEALEAVLRQLEVEDRPPVLVITGAGNNFCAGADLEELQARDHRHAFSLSSARIFDQLALYPNVTFAALNGPAIGGGMELALACDIRIGCPEAWFALPEVSRGLLPAAGGTRRLPGLVGMSRARAMILGAQRMSAREALECGLISELVEKDALLSRSEAWASKLEARDPLSVRLAKRSLDAHVDGDAQRHATIVSQALLYELAHRDVSR